jgi:polyvinyl alcohol dehydrogenase (cytochrome)
MRLVEIPLEGVLLTSRQRKRTALVGVTIIAVAILLTGAFLAAPSVLGGANSSSSSSQSGFSGTKSTTSSSSSATTASNSVSIAGDWLTYHGDNARDGYDTSLANVTSPSVNWKSVVDGPVYAEPLSFNGSIYVATENDTVYALSASDGVAQWSNHLGNPANSTAQPFSCNGDHPSIAPTIGITGTPTVDPATGTIYIVALIDGSGYWLFALSTTSGQVRWSASVTEAGLNYTYNEQRGALTLANGMVYVPFGGYSLVCTGIPHGWVVGYSSSGNGTSYAYEVPSSGEGDVWEPEGLSVDGAGFLYAVTGNSATNGSFDYGASVIKLTPDLSVVDYFSPTNYLALDEGDQDLSTTGATQLPGNLIFSIGKEGVGYLLNSSNLGGVGGQLASLSVCPGGAWGSTAYASGIIYIPCIDGIHAVAVHAGADPGLTSLWNYTNFFAGPPIVAAGAVWTSDIYNGTLFALNPETGDLIAQLILDGGLAPGSLEHFATPSVAPGLVLFAVDETIYALSPSP